MTESKNNRTADTHTNIGDRIAADFDNLPDQLRQAARFVLEHSAVLPVLSMREAAKQAGVKPKTMLRLIRRFGIDTYLEFRQNLIEAQRPQKPAILGRADRAQAIGGKGSGLSAFIHGFFALETQNIEASYELLDADTITAAAQAIAQAGQVYVMGRRTMYSAAVYLRYALGKFMNISLLDDADGSLTDKLERFGPDSVMVAFSQEPYAKRTVETMIAAGEAGATTISVTDSVASPVARHSDITVLVSANRSSFPESLVATMLVSQLLVAAVIRVSGSTALDSIARTEDRVAASGELWYTHLHSRSSGTIE